MSSSLAIAAVTATLRSLLDTELGRDMPGTKVSTQPPDKVRTTGTSGQLNLFLYHVGISAAWRNTDVPRQGKPGELTPPPLPLVLHYLITAYYGDSEDAVDLSATSQLVGSHRVLGRAMSILHDHPIFTPAEINANLPELDRAANPFDQTERVRVTPYPLSLDDISKIWTGFQSQLRVSAAYEVSVVIIDSLRPAIAPLPVLTRGPHDEGIATPPAFPRITGLRLPNNQPAALLGDDVTLLGENLDGAPVQVRFVNVRGRLPAPIVLPGTATATEITTHIPNEPSNWAAGLYTVEAIVTQADGTVRTTNQGSLALAPRLTLPAAPINRSPTGTVTFTAYCLPQLRQDQNVVFWLGDREIKPQAVMTPANPAPPPALDPAAPTALDIRIDRIEPGTYWARLRVDNEDSLLVDRTTTPGRYDPSQKVTVV